jgi:hypothetical protein
MSSEINKVLAERGENYGDFVFVAFRSQQIQNHLRAHDPEKQYTSTQREALQMIASKLARIVIGNPNHRDSWIDIAGYAQLVADSIVKSETKNEDLK